MPIYEYRCTSCETEFEELSLSRESAAEVRCHHCDSKRVVRVLSAFAVQGASGAAPVAESGPCGCGAPRRGMCGE